MTRDVKCDKCDYGWVSKSEMWRVSCPKCGATVKVNGRNKKKKGVK